MMNWLKVISAIFILFILVSVSACDDLLPSVSTTTSTTTTTETTTVITTSTTTSISTTTEATTDTTTTTTTVTAVTSTLKVHFIDVGQGDAILLDCGETEVLIDAGDGTPEIYSYLEPLVDGAIEVMIATHPHADHIGGLDEVLADFDVAEVWHNGDTSTSQTYQRYMNAVTAENCEIHEARHGDIITAGPLTFTVLHPVDLGGTTNNNSVVVWLTFGEIDFLFMGDAEVEAEAEMLAATDIPVPDIEILKVGHHGSRTASSPDFLAVTTPEVAIYMCAEDNSYGHPHDETITALFDIGAEVYGTENYGTITITCDGTTYTVEPELPKW